LLAPFSRTPAMIIDLRDLEPLLSQYDPGLILVGPVLSLSMGGHRYFYIAGNGSKVFESISLGYSENEAEAEDQRENVTTILKSRFREMLVFDSHSEMAQTANTRWPNEETAKILALAALLAEPKPGAAAREGGIEDESQAQGIAADDGQQPIAELAQEPVEQDDRAALRSALPWAREEPLPAQAQEPPSPPAGVPPRSGRADGPPGTLQQMHSGREDDIVAITRALRPSRQSQTGPKPAPTARSSHGGDRVAGERPRDERSSDLLAIMASFTHPHLDQADVAEISRSMEPPDPLHTPLWFALGRARNLAALVLLMLTVGGASAWFTRAVVRSGTGHEVGTTTTPRPAAATAPSAIPAQQTASTKPVQFQAEPRTATDKPALPATTSSPPAQQPFEVASAQDKQNTAVPAPRPEQRAKANGPSKQIAAAPPAAVASPPALQPPGAASTQAKTVPTSRPEQQAIANGAPPEVVGAPAATTPAPTTPAPSTAQSAGASSTQAKTVPASRPDQQAMASGPPPEVEAAPVATMPAPLPARSAGGASTQPTPAPASRPEQQPAANEPALRVEAVPAAVAATPLLLPGGASIQAKPGPAPDPRQRGVANEPTHQIEPAAATTMSSQLTPQPSGGAGIQAPSDSSSERQAIASISQTQPTPAQTSGTVSRVDSQEITSLIERGTAFLKKGDLASARLLLRRAADNGSADAALKLGSTFDPVTIEQLGVVGVEPDVALARQWYQRAAALGSDAAAQRLAKLKNQ